MMWAPASMCFTWSAMFNSYSPLSHTVLMTVVASLSFLISPLADIAMCLQAPLTKRGRGILSENYKSEHCGKRGMRMRKGCVIRRNGISFFCEDGGVMCFRRPSDAYPQQSASFSFGAVFCHPGFQPPI